MLDRESVTTGSESARCVTLWLIIRGRCGEGVGYPRRRSRREYA